MKIFKDPNCRIRDIVYIYFCHSIDPSKMGDVKDICISFVKYGRFIYIQRPVIMVI